MRESEAGLLAVTDSDIVVPMEEIYRQVQSEMTLPASSIGLILPL